jgi:hypothetical protein
MCNRKLHKIPSVESLPLRFRACSSEASYRLSCPEQDEGQILNEVKGKILPKTAVSRNCGKSKEPGLATVF